MPAAGEDLTVSPNRQRFNRTIVGKMARRRRSRIAFLGFRGVVDEDANASDRVASRSRLAGISHESNSFNVHPTRLEDFRQSPDVALEGFTREVRRLADMLWGTRDQLTLRARAPAAVWFEVRRYKARSE